MYDRTVACPTPEGHDPLDAYVEVAGDRTTLAMATLLREDRDLKIAESCYWVLRPERDTWVTDVSQLQLQLDAISGGYLYVMQGSKRNNITDSVI